MTPWWIILGGLAFALAGGYIVRSGLRLRGVPDRTGWLRVPGEITEWRTGQRIGPPDGTDVRTHPRYPVVRYQLPDGSLNVFVNRTTMDTGLYLTGGRVEVLVDPQDPRRAELSTTGRDQRLISWGHLGLGAVFVVLGLLVCAGGVVWLLVTS